MAYHWIITKDIISDGEDVGMSGPRNIEKMKAVLEGKETITKEFKLFDDDKNLYYEGTVTYDPDGDDDAPEYAPLEDFGMGWAGCTLIQIKNKDGVFEYL